jgi:hypothetical protein
MALPWNCSIDTIDSWLHNSNCALADLNGRPNRAPLLVDFMNYMFSLNDNAWQQGEPFLSTGDIKRSSANGMAPNLPPTSPYLQTTPPDPSSQVSSHYHLKIPFSVPLSSSTGCDTLPFQANAPPSTARPASRHSRRRTAKTGPRTLKYGAPPTATQICRRYNAGQCLNHHTSCCTASGIRLLHVCDGTNALGQQCAKYHTLILVVLKNNNYTLIKLIKFVYRKT